MQIVEIIVKKTDLRTIKMHWDLGFWTKFTKIIYTYER